MKANIKTFNDVPAAPLSNDDVMLQQLGIMKTIYVPVHPFVNGIKAELATRSDEIMKMFSEPHKRTQDNMHEAFFTTYVEWANQAVKIDPKIFKFHYPTSGSNEAIRETIAHHGNLQQKKGHSPRIHIFKGEYEGYRAHADAHQVEVIEHDRENYQDCIDQHLRAGDPFYISAPSSIDGNIWDGYEAFLTFLENHHPTTKLMVDLAYLNTTKKTPNIRVDSEVIETIFISMSKSFPGTYYDRIGGMLSKQELPGLFGNMWFKNLPGLLLGRNLMENSTLGDIPKEMSIIQERVVKQLQKTFGVDLTPSDVTFVATQSIPDEPSKIQTLLKRNNIVRYCLTPAIHEALNK